MTTIEKSVAVRVPVSTAYNQWTQFESFPKFMEGVERITQLTDTRTHWVTKIGGAVREFDAEITEQHPEERIAWHTVDGPSQAGVVTFHRLDDETTRVDLRMEYHPDSLAEKAGAALGVVSHRVQDDLERFKEFIEHQGTETGAWRGHVDRPPQRGEQPAGDPGRHPEAPLGSPGGHTRGGGTGVDGAGEPDLADRGGTSERSLPPRGGGSGGGSGGGMGNLSDYPEASEPGPLPE